MRKIAFILPLLFVAACSQADPERDQFVDLCTNNGDSDALCDCTFKVLEAQMGEVDLSVIDFVADFAKWNQADASQALDKAGMKEKHQLSEEDYLALAEQVGGAMITSFNQCSAEG